jgi:hypothetical protein
MSFALQRSTSGVAPERKMTELDRLRDFGERHTSAWCSRIPRSVAEFCGKGGSLSVNAARAAAGPAAISAIAAGLMSAFPDMRLRMDDVVLRAGGAVYRWTFFGTNSGLGEADGAFVSADSRNGRLVATA